MVEKCEENLDNPRFWELAASILGEAPTKHVELDATMDINVVLDDED